jgi:colicin import membrane protein
MPVTGTSLAALAGGSVLLWSAVTGKSVLMITRNVISGGGPGAVPAGSADTAPGAAPGSASASGGNATGGSDAANEALGRSMAALYGWGTGAEWTALNNIVMAESGWDDEAANRTSDARGIAQNINGWSSSYQEGNASQQIAWLLSYIKGRYGDPIAAWQFHVANGWY